MTPAGWVWLIGGLPLALMCAVYWQRHEVKNDEEWTSGLIFLSAWIAAPFIVAGGLTIGAIGAITFLVRRLERHVPDRPTREALEARVAELEHELEIS